MTAAHTRDLTLSLATVTDPILVEATPVLVEMTPILAKATSTTVEIIPLQVVAPVSPMLEPITMEIAATHTQMQVATPETIALLEVDAQLHPATQVLEVEEDATNLMMTAVNAQHALCRAQGRAQGSILSFKMLWCESFQTRIVPVFYSRLRAEMS